ncbi:MAG: hypothetical protein H0X33_11710 [Taibaiella sp.]|nr:hypothetical protein [Taibaiella sp.]
MQRIPVLLQKLNELAEKDDHTIIEIDLMMDYTRVLYADLLEWRGKEAYKIPVPKEPTLEELTRAMQPETPVVAPKSPSPSIPQASVPLYIAPATPFQAPPPRRDIRNNIGINDKYLFISELFGSDTTAYEQALNELNAFDNHHEAMNWIHEHLYMQYGWEEESEAVQTFYTALNNTLSSI